MHAAARRLPTRQVALLLLILAGGAFLRARHLDAPFGAGFRGVNAAAYYGQFTKNYRRHGLLGCRFGLVLLSWPGTDRGMVRDLGHPATPSWVFYAAVLLVGDDEIGLRIVPILAGILGVLALFMVARRVLAPPGALAAALLAAMCPMTAYFGVMVVAESFLLLMGSLTVLAVMRYQEGRSSLALPLLVFFAGCLLDWSFYFFAPAALLAAAVATRGRPYPWKLLWMLPVGVLAFLIYLVHAAWAAGGWGVLFARLEETATTALTIGDFGPWEWMHRQATFLAQWYGVALLALFGLWLLMGVLRPRGPGAPAAPVVFFMVAGALHVGMFYRHAWVHDFWSLPLAGGLCLGAAAGFERLWRTRRALPAAAGLLLLLGTGAWGVQRTVAAQEEELTGRFRDRVAVVNAQAGGDDIVVTSETWRQEAYYVEGRAVPCVRSLAQLRSLIDRYQELGLHCRILLFLPEAQLARDADLQAMAAWVAPFCKPSREAGRFRLYVFTPPG